MAADDVAICNLALAKLGHDPLTDLLGTDKKTRLCNAFYEPLRDEVLIAHPWNFALTRTSLTLGGMSAAVVVNAGTGGTPGAVTVTGTTGEGTFFAATGTIDGSGLLTDPLVVSVAGAYTTFPDDLTAEPVTGGGLTGATVALTRATAQPEWEFSAAFDLPTDCLKVWKVRRDKNHAARPWKVEGRQILTDMGAPLPIQYIRRITDTTLFAPLFETTLSDRLAEALALPIAQSQTLKDQLQKDFQTNLRRARSTDAQEGTPDQPRSDVLIDAMRSW